MARKSTTNTAQEEQIRQLRSDGMSLRKIAETVGISVAVVRRVLKSEPDNARAREGDNRHEIDDVSPEAVIASYQETASIRKTAAALDIPKGRVESILRRPEYAPIKEAMKRARRAGVEIRPQYVEEKRRQAEIDSLGDYPQDMEELRRTEKQIAKSAMNMYNMVAASMQLQFERAVDKTTLEVKDEAAFGEFWKKFGPKDAAQAHRIWKEMIDPNAVPGNHFDWFVAEVADGITQRVKDQDLQLSLLTMLNAKIRETKNATKQGRDLER